MKRIIGLLVWYVGSLTAIAAIPPSTTTLTMNLDVSNGIVAPAGPSRVRVPPGENVVLVLPDAWTYPIQWTKNGVAIAGATSRTLSIIAAGSGDSGTYLVTGAPAPYLTTGIALDVVPSGNIGNISSRVELAPSGVQIVGFVVSGHTPKNLLFRAVGPTLSLLGVPNPARKPVVKCYDSAGHEVGFAHIAIVIDVNGLFQSIGAFPISAAELPTLSYDYGPFQPGAYTLHVSDAANTGGTALVEVYEMP